MHSKRLRRRDLCLAGLAAGFSAAAPRFALAQAWPNHAIKIVVPAVAGGGLDTIARIVAQKSAELLGQSMYVENKPGANWIIGMDFVAKSPPDGYTLLLLSGSGLSINPHVFKNVPSLEEFTPITLPTKGTFVLMVNPKLAPKTARDFIAHLKANPGKLNHASNSATTLLISELFKADAGVDYVDVNYRGGAQAVTDTLSGVTDFCFVDLGTAIAFIQQGSLRALGVTSLTKYELAPDIPPLAEAGVSIAVDGGTALVAPANLPTEIVATLSGVFRRALASPEVRRRFETLAQAAFGPDADETRRILRAESARWKKLIVERNIQIAP